MSDLINLNAQLGGRLKALQNLWNHDTASETLATVFDICVNRWDVKCPNLTALLLDKGLRVTLKSRHVAHFSKMAQLAGCTVSEVARSMLIQWLCAHDSTLLLPQLAQQPQKITQLPPQSTPQLPPTRAKKTPKKSKPSPALTVVEPTPTAPEKFNAKASLLALKKG